jgi:hypothetical protein
LGQWVSLLTEIDSPFPPELGADLVKGRGCFHKFSRKGGSAFLLDLHYRSQQSQPFLEDTHSSPDLIKERANLASPDSRGAVETHQIPISLSPPWSGFLLRDQATQMSRSTTQPPRIQSDPRRWDEEVGSSNKSCASYCISVSPITYPELSKMLP